MKAIILARGSTKAQEEGHSIAAQRLRLVDYCVRKGLKVIKTYELVESSTRGERKEFAAMPAFAQAQNETVAIVADAVDRFQRSFKESVLICDQLIRKEKVELHFHQEGTIIGKGASSMVASLSKTAVSVAPRGTNRRIRCGVFAPQQRAAHINTTEPPALAWFKDQQVKKQDPAERSAIGSSRVGSSDHTLPVAASISRTFQR